MASTRPWEVCISEISTAKGAIYKAFDSAFAEGKESPEGYIYYKREVFRFVWKLFDRQFDSLENMDAYFAVEIDGLENKIKKFCDEKLENRDDDFDENPEIGDSNSVYHQITNDKKEICLQLVGILHFFIKIQFLLNQFQAGDAPENFSKDKIFIDSQFATHRKSLETLDPVKSQEEIDQLKALLGWIGYALAQKAYLPKVHEEVRTSIPNIEERKAIQDAIDFLPSVSDVSQAVSIRQANPAHQGDVTVREYIIDSHGIINRQLHLVLDRYKKRQAAITAAQDSANLFLDFLSRNQKLFFACNLRLLAMVNALGEINNYVRELSVLSRRQSSAEKIPLAKFVSTPVWNDAATVLDTTLGDVGGSLIKCLNIFLNSYRASLDDKNLFKAKETNLRAGLDTFTKINANLNTQIKSTNENLKKYSKAIRAQESRLKNASIKQHEQTSFSVFRHWGKGLVGGLVGGGLAVLGVMLLIPGWNVLVMVAAVVTTVLIGAGLSVGAGLAFDSCRAYCQPSALVVDDSLSSHVPDIDKLNDMFDSDSEEETSQLDKSDSTSAVSSNSRVSFGAFFDNRGRPLSPKSPAPESGSAGNSVKNSI